METITKFIYKNIIGFNNVNVCRRAVMMFMNDL